LDNPHHDRLQERPLPGEENRSRSLTPEHPEQAHPRVCSRGAALAGAEQAHTATLRAFELAAERARYEAGRARRQYDAVEPENRLVARTLERALESKLAAQRQAERDLIAQQARRPVQLTGEELAWLAQAGADVRAVFNAPATTFRERKQLLRAILTEVIVTVDTTTRTAAIAIIWQGGARTEITMPMTKTGGHFQTTSEDTAELIRRLAVHYDDTTIAVILGRQHRQTGTGLPFTKGRVKTPRVSRGIPAFQPPAATVTPGSEDAVVVTVAEAERLLGVGKVTIYRWLRDGFLAGEQLTPNAPWRIRIDQTVRDRIVPQVPDGWVGLDEAAAILGIARQTVLHKVQRGDLAAVHVNRGRRKGLRINVRPDQAGLFDQSR
jgi:hypothetical protein